MTEQSALPTATIDSAAPATLEQKAEAAGMKKAKLSPSTKAFRTDVVAVLQNHAARRVKADAMIAILADMIGTLIPTLPAGVTEADVLNLVNVNVRRGAAKSLAELQKTSKLG
jgi:hypothetical protein